MSWTNAWQCLCLPTDPKLESQKSLVTGQNNHYHQAAFVSMTTDPDYAETSQSISLCLHPTLHFWLYHTHLYSTYWLNSISKAYRQQDVWMDWRLLLATFYSEYYQLATEHLHLIFHHFLSCLIDIHSCRHSSSYSSGGASEKVGCRICWSHRFHSLWESSWLRLTSLIVFYELPNCYNCSIDLHSSYAHTLTVDRTLLAWIHRNQLSSSWFSSSGLSSCSGLRSLRRVFSEQTFGLPSSNMDG